jgi:hypothetical protein
MELTVRDTDKASDSRQYFPLEVVKQFDREGGNSQQHVKAVTDHSELQQLEQNVRNTDEIGNSRQYFLPEVVGHFECEGGNSQRPHQAVDSQQRVVSHAGFVEPSGSLVEQDEFPDSFGVDCGDVKPTSNHDSDMENFGDDVEPSDAESKDGIEVKCITLILI